LSHSRGGPARSASSSSENRAEHGQQAHADTPENGRSLAVRVAERVTEALRQPLAVKGIQHLVTASIGITYATRGRRGGGERSATADEVLHDADAAMYRAKDRGKNRFELFEGDRRDPDLQRDTLPLSVGRR
jgi:GGDEF domain-containing protein